MKKQLLLCAVTILQLNLFGQTEKGGKLIGVSLGTFNFTNQTQRDYRNNSSNPGPPYTTNLFNFTVSPSIAWLVSKNVAMGPYVICNYSYSKVRSSGSSANSSTFNIIFGPQVRGYLSSGQKGKAFMDMVLGVGFLSGKEVQDNGYYSDNEYKITSNGNFNGSLAFGYEHFITKSIGLFGALGVGYSAMNIKYDDGHGSSYSTVDISKVRSVIFPVQFGFQIHLPAKEKEEK